MSNWKNGLIGSLTIGNIILISSDHQLMLSTLFKRHYRSFILLVILWIVCYHHEIWNIHLFVLQVCRSVVCVNITNLLHSITRNTWCNCRVAELSIPRKRSLHFARWRRNNKPRGRPSSTQHSCSLPGAKRWCSDDAHCSAHGFRYQSCSQLWETATEGLAGRFPPQLFNSGHNNN